MGKAQRDKGAQGERELAKILNDHGIKAHRGYVQFKQSDLVGVDGIHVEVKRQETAKIWESLGVANMSEPNVMDDDVSLVAEMAKGKGNMANPFYRQNDRA